MIFVYILSKDNHVARTGTMELVKLIDSHAPPPAIHESGYRSIRTPYPAYERSPARTLSAPERPDRLPSLKRRGAGPSRDADGGLTFDLQKSGYNYGDADIFDQLIERVVN